MTLGVIILLLAVIVGVGTRIIGRPSTNSLPARTTATPSKYPNFKGIYQFGSSYSTLAANPYIAGTTWAFTGRSLSRRMGSIIGALLIRLWPPG